MNSSSLVIPQITQRIPSSGVITHEHESFIKPECIPESLDVATWGALFPKILLYAPLCVTGTWVRRKLRFPTAFMLGPMIVMCVVQLSTAMHTPNLPTSLLNVMSMIIFSLIPCQREYPFDVTSCGYSLLFVHTHLQHLASFNFKHNNYL